MDSLGTLQLGTRSATGVTIGNGTNAVTLTSGSSLVTTGVTFPSVGGSQLLSTDASNALIGSNITGTPNRVTVSGMGTASITLSGPQDIGTASSPTFTGLTLSASQTLSYSTASRWLALNASKNVVAQELLGITNQTIITGTPGSGTVTIGLPQDIATSSTPFFTRLTLTAASNQLVLSPGNSLTITCASPAASQIITLPDPGGAASFMLTTGNQTASGVLTLSNTTDATSSSTGALVTSGGIGVAKSVWVANDVVVANTRAYRMLNNAGTAQSILTIDSSDNIRVRGGGGSMLIAPDATATSVTVSQGSSINTTFFYNMTQMLQVNSTGLAVGTAAATNGITLNNSTASYSPTVLNFYESTATVNLNFTGAWTATKTVKLNRIGNIVTAMFQTATATATAGATLTSGADIPARFRPSQTVSYPAIAVNNGAVLTTAGSISVSSGGVVTAFSDCSAGSFTNGTTSGYNGTCVSWNIQ